MTLRDLCSTPVGVIAVCVVADCLWAGLVGQLLGEAIVGLLRQAEPGRAAAEGYMYVRIV